MNDEARFHALMKPSSRDLTTRNDDYYDEYSDVEDEDQQKSDTGNIKTSGAARLRKSRFNSRNSRLVMLDANNTAEMSSLYGSDYDDMQNTSSIGMDVMNSTKDGDKQKSDIKIHMNKLALCTNTSSLAELMAASEADIATYQTQSLQPGENEKHRDERYSRQLARDGKIKELKAQATHILAAAKSDQTGTRKPMSEKLEHWEKALELLTQVSSVEAQSNNMNIDSMALLDMLMNGCHDVSLRYRLFYFTRMLSPQFTI